MLRKERMSLDLLSTIDTKTLRWISVQKSSEDQTCQRTDFLPKDERVVEDLLVRLVSDLCQKAKKMRRD
jgi:hypothetical protein